MKVSTPGPSSALELNRGREATSKVQNEGARAPLTFGEGCLC